MLFCSFFIFFYCSLSYADIVHLKNGGLIKGVVDQETENTVIVKIAGGKVTLERKDIEYIEKGKFELEEKDIKEAKDKARPSMTAEERIRNMFSEFIEALKNRDVKRYYDFVYNQSYEDGKPKVQNYQMNNTYSYIANNPYTIRFARGRREALLTFKESRNETACPYIVVYRNGKWQIDYDQMWKRIRFGPGNKWYWYDKWNK
jgi:hypothetical protein